MASNRRPPAETKVQRGRPPKAAAARKDALIRVRVTEDQKALLMAAADEAGLDVSAWLRALALREATKGRPSTP